MTLYEDLKWRGLVKDVVGEESKLQELLDGNPFTFYWGTDPTADSLHLGHYSSLCLAKRLSIAGHHPSFFVGALRDASGIHDLQQKGKSFPKTSSTATSWEYATR